MELDRPNGPSPESRPEPPSDENAPSEGDAPSHEAVPGGHGEALTFSIVGVGASAGGLKAFCEFFAGLPAAPDMAFVLVQHLAPDHESELAELLQNHTPLRVVQVTDGVEVEPGGVYVIPPGKALSIRDGVLHLAEPERPHGHRAPIDDFFRSLAADQGERAACVVLSGTGSDGTLGLKTLKEAGGLTAAQDPGDAEYDGMPRSAVGTGFVDVVLPARGLGARLVELRKQGLPLAPTAEPGEDDNEALAQIFARLRAGTGHDFSRYKQTTVLRRVGRRMQVTGAGDLADYLQALRKDPREVEALLKDLLISVTNFFRDPEAFAVLERRAIPKMFEGKGAGDQVRVWVPGCATGEEAYSLAILLCEHAAALDYPPELQIFATDIDEEALQFARTGVYPETIAADVMTERLDRFFDREGEHYRVKESLRECVLFAEHNLLKDPPFSKLDLISCRNLLIYLQRDTQQQVFELFAYALRDPGFLFLGTSESVEGTKELFATLDKKRRLFQGRGVMRHGLRFPAMPPLSARAIRKGQAPTNDGTNEDDAPASLDDLHERLLLRHHAPPSVIVSQSHEILHVAGDVGRYLTFAPGRPTTDLLKVVRPGLRPELRTALFHAVEKQRVTDRLRVRTRIDDAPVYVVLTIRPLRDTDGAGGLVQIVFEEEPAAVSAVAPADQEKSPAVEHLETELQRTRDRLQSTVEEYETSTEELKASNEELLSMNEELQSTTEELETGREELQSVNEELSTVNQELKTKIEQLGRANADLKNLINSTDVATLFLDRNLRIHRFTPRLGELFNVLPGDHGRPITHLTQKIAYDAFVDEARGVLDTLVPLEREVAADDGRRFLTRIVPYRTADDRIEGVVATFLDITRRVEAEEAANRREARFRRAVADAPIPVLLHAEDGEILQLSRTLTEITGYTPEELPTVDAWAERAYGEHAERIADDIDRLYELDGRVDEGEYRVRTKGGEERVWQFSSSPVGTDGQGRRLVVSMAADLTERRRAEQARAAQQTALADFGVYALVETDLPALFDRAVAVVHETLGTDFSKILELQPDGEALLLRAGLGWREGLVGRAMVPADAGSQAGYTLTVDEPVVVDDLEAETRFQGPALLTEHAVVSGMSVVIGGLGDPFGVFGTHTRAPRAFTSNEARFFQAVANVVASAVERIEAYRVLEERVDERTHDLRESEARLRLLYDIVSHPAENFGEQVERALRLTADLLALDAGILSRIEGDTYTVEYCHAPGLGLEAGQTFSTEKTPCAITLKEDRPVFIEKLSDSEYEGHPCRDVFDTEAYAGAPVRVGGALYGTINFTSPTPKEPPFADGGRELLALLARWLGSALEREAAQTALRDEKERTERIIESSVDGIIAYDHDLRYTVWNPGMEQIARLKAEDVLGRVTYEVFPFLREIGEVEAQRAALRGERVTTEERPYTVPESGRTGFFEGRYAPLRNAEGEIVGGLGIVRDVTEAKRAREEIEQSEQILAGVLLGSLDGIAALQAVRDAEGNIEDFEFLIVNPAAAEVYGRRAEDLIGRRYLSALPGTMEAGVFDAFVRVVETGEPYRGEVYYDADNITGWFDFTIVKLGDGVAQTFRDVTEKKEAERALRESEGRFRELFESSPDAIFVESLDGVVLDVNPAACRLHHASREWLIGRDLSELVPPEYRERAQQDFERLAAGEIGLLESHSYTADGLVVPVEVRTDRITYGGQEAVLLHVRDVTEREIAEQALRESEERFAKAFHAAPVAMTISTFSENRFLDVNQSYSLLTGYTREELIGRTPGELEIPVGDADAPPGRDQLEQEGHVHALELTVRTRDGALRDVLTSAELIEVGGMTCILSIGFDVTDRKRLEREVIEAAELERRRIGQDLHDELGQQLTGAAFLSQVLSQRLDAAERAEAEDARQLTAIINDVIAETRDFSRLLSPVDVFADGLVDALQDLADHTGRIFDAACTLDTESDIRIRDNVVATHLYRIAQEAVNNAIKHADPSAIRIALRQDASGLHLRVEDDGTGIDASSIEQPAGIGLRTMRYRAALIGGTLRISPTADGSAVTVVVPSEGREG
jgi:two-component system CheB/CheR fusion protein